ncbi:MAG: citramalate synthase [Coriobacteriales bacterium]|nr:citramalate synthase [Coriobacteriales bacterium]
MIQTYDTTLRDGQQREGVSLTVEDKVYLATRLDVLGVDFIEGGYPASNHRDRLFFEQACSLDLRHATLVAFGTTLHKNADAEHDESLALLTACPAPIVALVGKAWTLQVAQVLETTCAENLRMVSSSIAFLKRAGKRVFFDAEHFFDGYREDAAYALEVLLVAAQAGAETLVLCDTNGGMLPHEVYAATTAAVAALEQAKLSQVRIGIHAHNDSGCGVANSLEAVRAGATQVQGTICGYGERVGNADLLTCIADLQLKLGYDLIGPERLKLLTPTAHAVAETFNIAFDAHLPYVGTSAFSHKGGLHASAALREHGAYEHIDPHSVGNFSHIVVSELAGKAALRAKAGDFELPLPEEGATLQALLDTVKNKEDKGYSYEVADASLELLLRDQMGEQVSYFGLESFRVIAERRADGIQSSEATIKLRVGGERHIATAEGNGPVNALDAALREAITRFYPQVKSFELSDYKVRVLDESSGTDAVIRTLIETSDGKTSWKTIGVSENVIEASWDALVDAITYGLLKSGCDGEPRERRTECA